MGRHLSPQYGQVIQVSKYFVLTTSFIVHNMDVKYQFAGSSHSSWKV